MFTNEFTFFLGETIEILDIGLRHSRSYNAFHRVKPSQASHHVPSSPTSHSKSVLGRFVNKGMSVSSIALSKLSNGGFKRGSGTSGFATFYTSPDIPPSVTFSQDVNVKHYPVAEVQEKPEEVKVRSSTSSSNTTNTSTSSSEPSPSHITSPIPPPHFLHGRSERGSSNTSNDTSKYAFHQSSSMDDEESTPEEGWKEREYIAKEGHLQRARGFYAHSPKKSGPKEVGNVGKQMQKMEIETSNKGKESQFTEPYTHRALHRASPLKQSFNYRKIELQEEKPLFNAGDDGADTSDDADSIVGEKSSQETVPQSMHQQVPIVGDSSPLFTSVQLRRNSHRRRQNLSGPPIGRRTGGFDYPIGIQDRLVLV